MYKKILLFLFFTITIFGTSQRIPVFIDFANEQFDNHFYQEKFNPDYARYAPFNGASDLATFFAYLKNVLHIDTVVETGTFKGNTTSFFASMFNHVHTAEVCHEFFLEAESNLRVFNNVVCHEGSSPQILRDILPSLSDRPVIFYLDAHWYNEWPLLDELTEISKTHRNNCIIVIDDFKVPYRSDVPYDTHCVNGVFYEYAYPYIKRHLEKIFSNYTIHYLIPKNVLSRAKFVAMPCQWSIAQ